MILRYKLSYMLWYNNRPVSCKALKNVVVFNWGCAISGCCLETLKYTEIHGTQKFIATGAQTIIIRMKQWSLIHRLPAGVWMGMMLCNIGKNHTIFCQHVDHKCYYDVKTNQ